MRLAPVFLALVLTPVLGCDSKPPADPAAPTTAGADDGAAAPSDDCPPPDAGCMNEENHAQCLEKAKECPGKVLQLESCPLQFSCG